MPPKVITIVNQKGGTGKTTLTALLGFALASQGYRILLIDLDPQSHLSSFFIKLDELENMSEGLIELVQGARFRIRKIRIKEVDGELGIIPSGLNYIISVYRGSIPSWDPYALYKRISTEPAINQYYDFILCDSPPELFPPTIWGLYAADYIIIPSNLEELSLLGVKLLIKEILPDVIMSSRKEIKVLGIALINVTRRWKNETINKIGRSIKRFIRNLPLSVRERFYIEPFFNTIIHRYDVLKDLTYRPRRQGLPIYKVLNSNIELRKEIYSLVNEMFKRMKDFEGLQ